MTRRRFLACLLAVTALSAAWPRSGGAIPVFARKYGFHCTMCHSHYPRLNDFGWRYRLNGYQVPGREHEEKTVLETSAPFAVRASVGYNVDNFKRTPEAEEVNQFQVRGVDLLSGGLFGRNLGYFLVYPPRIEPARGVVGQPGTVEMANVIFSRLGGSRWLNLRAGRFEPAYVAFSVKRQLSFSPYEIYDFAFPGGLAFSDTQSGVELAGYRFSGPQYALGWTNGTGSNRPDDSAADFYLRVARVFGRGEGQTVGQRLGLISYLGRARPEPPLPVTDRKRFHRLGVDASLNAGSSNLALQWLWGKDDAALWGTRSDVDFSGGFAQLLYLPSTEFVGFVRYDLVNTPGEISQDITRLTAGGRYYLADNLALHLEYSHRRQDSPAPGLGTPTEDFFTTALDFAF